MLSHLEKVSQDVGWKQRLRRRLLRWFDANARPLAWRTTRDPYRIWVSEIMLQQTQVATVEPYYHRFVQQFPTVDRLAAAPLDQVLRLWEGLGYYRRARQMHQAAREIVEQYGGRFPGTLEQLQSLPGIGRYTAGAILSISSDQRTPVLEANSARLLARLVGWPRPVAERASQQALWRLAESILPRKNVGRFNQALMELGSLVCRPHQPQCEACPLGVLCAARANGLADQIPVPAPRVVYQEIQEAAVMVRRAAHVLLRRCQDGERWAGLWDFLRFPMPAAGQAIDHQTIAALASQQSGLRVRVERPLGVIKHGVTRYRITLHCFLAAAERSGGELSPRLRWVPITELSRIPLSSTGRELSRLATW